MEINRFGLSLRNTQIEIECHPREVHMKTSDLCNGRPAPHPASARAVGFHFFSVRKGLAKHVIVVLQDDGTSRLQIPIPNRVNLIIFDQLLKTEPVKTHQQWPHD